MGPQLSPNARISFGPFEFDREAGELRKHGIRLKLAGQPLRILEMLLERPGDAVSREELQQNLWQGTTFVDFENGLNAAISKLRQALGDAANQPRYVETVPGRGYRFIGSANRIADPATITAPPVVAAVVTSHRPRWMAAGAAAVGVIALFSVWFLRERSAPTVTVNAPLVRFRVPLPTGMVLSGSQGFSLSPDGHTLVYIGRQGAGPLQLWTQTLDALEPKLLPGTTLSRDSLQFWSPDGKFVVYSAAEKLYKVDLNGNPPQAIGAAPFILGGDWNRDGTIIFGTETTGIMRIPASGGEAKPLISLDSTRRERVAAFPSFLPDGRHFIYSRFSTLAENTGIFVGSLDDKASQPASRRLLATPFAAQMVMKPDGNRAILFQRESTLWAQTFDVSRLTLLGEPKAVAEHVGSTRAYGFFAAASTALVTRSGLGEAGQLRWFDRSGKDLGSAGQGLDLWDASPAISPDGTRIAVSKFDENGTDIWVHDSRRDVTQKLTADPAPEVSPVWSPDGKRVVFSSSRAGHYDLYVIGADGGGEQLLHSSADQKFASSWSADGRLLLYVARAAKDRIWVLPMSGGAPFPITAGHANEWDAALSPDGKWIAYLSDAAGSAEVYIQPFAGQSLEGGARIQISKGGGRLPRWSGDGKGILYRSLDGPLMSVTVTRGVPGVARRLFNLPGSGWDISPDGMRILTGVPLDGAAGPFTVTLNWQADARR